MLGGAWVCYALHLAAFQLALQSIRSTAATVVLSSARPAAGNVNGGTVLAVTGTGFTRERTLFCRFSGRAPYQGSALATARFVSATELTCTAPAATFLRNSQGDVVDITGGHAATLSIASSASNSNSLPFLFFHLATMSLSAVRPSWGLNSTAQLVAVQGEGLVDVDSVRWFIGSGHHGNCTYNSSRAYLCTLSPFPFPSRQLIRITVDGSLDSGWIGSESILFDFYSTAPRPLGAWFGLAYTHLLVLFDREVEVGVEEGGVGGVNTTTSLPPPQCGRMFDSQTLRLLGNSSSCVWSNSRQRAVRVELGGDTAVREGSEVGVAGGVFRTRQVLFSELNPPMRLWAGPAPNHAPFTPVAVVAGPSVVPACSDEDDVVITGAHSWNSGPRPLEFMWNVTAVHEDATNFTADDDTVSMAMISGLLPQGFTYEEALVLPVMVFEENVSYTFTLTVKNFIGYHDNTSLSVSKQPVLAVLSGDSEIWANPLDDIIVGVTSITCNPSQELSLGWMVEDYSNRSNVADVTHLLDSRTLLSPLLWIPRNTLLPGRTYKLTASLLGNQYGSHSTLLRLAYPDVIVRFVGGAYMTLPLGQDLLLDVTPSVNIGYHGSSEVDVSWECLSGPASSACAAAIGEAPLVSAALRPLTVPAASLLPGTYVFTASLLAASLVARSPAANLTVAVAAATGPGAGGGARVVRVGRGKPCAAATDDVVVEALVRTPEVGVVKWEGLFVPGLAHLPLTLDRSLGPLSLPVIAALPQTAAEENPVPHLLATPTQWQGVSLVVRAGALLPGETYSFRLSYSVAMATVATSDAMVVVCSQPTSGRLDVVPVQTDCGVGLQLSAEGWTDSPSSLPLSYHFGLVYDQPQQTGPNWLGPPSTATSLSTVFLPPPAVAMVTAVVRVANSNGGVSTVSRSVPRPPATPPCQLEDRVQGAWSEFGRTSNYQQLLADLMAALPAATAATAATNSSLQGVYDLTVAMATHLHTHLLPRTTAHGLALVGVVRALVEWGRGGGEAGLAAVLLDLLSCEEGNSPSCPLSEEGLTTEEAELMLQAAEDLLYSGSRAERRRKRAGLEGQEGAGPVERQQRRVQAQEWSEEVVEALPRLGRALCQRQGLRGEPVVVATSSGKILLKASRTYFPELYSVSDVVMETDRSVFVQWSSQIEERFGARGEWAECYRHGNIAGQCDGVCLVAVRYSDDLHWTGVDYSPHIKTTPTSIVLFSQSNGSMIALGNLAEGVVTVSPLLYGQGSPRSNLQCAVWRPADRKWISTSCSQEVNIQSGSVTCTCSDEGDRVVIETCSSGYYGDNCTEVCPQGVWGVECGDPCACSGRGTCHAPSGSCNCSDGWIGQSCDLACPTGRYGYQCLEECRCRNGGVCSHVDGACGCQPGWVGPLCEQGCPLGRYGNGCMEQCQCRLSSQCDAAIGECLCDAGYHGDHCDQVCPEGQFGAGCSLRCGCSEQGAESCDRLNGSCYCLPGWTGLACSAPPPQPVAGAPPYWAAGAGLSLLLLVGLSLVPMVLGMWWWRRRRRKRGVQPASRAHMESDSILLVKTEVLPGNDSEGEDLNITKTTSLDVIVPKGSSLADMFSHKSGGRGAAHQPGGGGGGVFKEPAADIDGTPRWTLVRLHHRTTPHPPPPAVGAGDTDTTEGGRGSVAKEYEKGVYMSPEALLKDLRSAFLDSGQVPPGEELFLFCTGREGRQSYSVEDEEMFMLKDFQPTMAQPRTFYIRAAGDEDEVAKDLCVCGRVAEYDCGRCEGRGYCSARCQETHHRAHRKACRSTRRQRKAAKRRAEAGTSMEPPDLCVCGKPAEFECSSCGVRGYCSTKCQLDHWSVHQNVCVFTTAKY